MRGIPQGQARGYSKRLGVSLKSTVALCTLVELLLGEMTKWGMAKVMCQCRGFSRIGVECLYNASRGPIWSACFESLSQAPGNLRDLHGMS
jgi:hypothetical protein